MKYAIGATTIIVATALLIIMNKDKLDKTQATPSIKEEDTQSIEVISPDTLQSNNYIEEQLNSLDLEPLEPSTTNASMASSLSETEKLVELLSQSEINITQANKSIIVKPLETYKIDDSETDAQLYDRLAKQTGLSIAEIEKLFANQ